jgi:succinoglycan biosynthesis transport protein ExoP
MSTQESTPQETDFGPEQAITIQPSAIAPYAGAGDWPAAGEIDSTAGAGLGLDTLLHSLRRHWLVMVAMGIAASAVAVTIVWLTVKQKFEAEAFLNLSPFQPVVLHNPGGEESDRVADEFNIFRNSQASVLKQRYVLVAALRNPKMKNLPSILREDAKHKTIPWLTSVIQAVPEKNSSYLRVSAALPDANEAATIVNAVVEAYMDEVVNRDRDKRRERLDSLNSVSVQKEEEDRKLREDLKHEMESMGVGDDQTASLRGQMAVQIFAEYQRELQKMRFDRTSMQAKLQEDGDLLKSVGNRDEYKVSETEIAAVLVNNPVYHELLPRQQMLQTIVGAGQKMMVKGIKPSPAFQQALAQLQATNDNIEGLRLKADEQVRQSKQIDLEREMRRLKTEIDIANEQVLSFQKEVENKSRDADAVGKSTVAAQILRGKLENVERIRKGVDEERARLQVELDNSRPRVTIAGDKNAPAAVPEEETGAVARYLLIAACGLVGLCLPAACIVVWDVRKRRVNTPGDVAKKLKISVMGTLPLIPPPVMRKLGHASRRSQMWRMRYTEAVDGVVARLLRNAECDQTRVVLVTSAGSGEGKTWLATQLAMGLARAQRSTVLLDFDLRHPALDGALGLPLGPGVCEALRGQGEIADMVQRTDTESLSVVTAGAWNRQVLPALANGSIAPIMDQLRARFDFVIVDSSPLLPTVDTRLLCQHVDAVLLSVLRDVSEAEKVLAAQEMLDSFGVAHVDAVVTSGEQLGNSKTLLSQEVSVDDHHAGTSDGRSALMPDEAQDGATSL